MRDSDRCARSCSGWPATDGSRSTCPASGSCAVRCAASCRRASRTPSRPPSSSGRWASAALHASGRESGARGAGPGRRGSLPRAARQDHRPRPGRRDRVKPTQLGLDLDADATLAHLRSLASHAAEAGAACGGHGGIAYTQATLDLYRALKATSRRRHLPAGLPATHPGRHDGAASAPAAGPAREGRLRRAGGDRVPQEGGGGRRIPVAVRCHAPPVGPGACGPGLAPTTPTDRVHRRIGRGAGVATTYEFQLLFGIGATSSASAAAGHQVRVLIS